MTNFPSPSSLLPHRAPFLFVDAITELTPGISASAIWRLTGNETFFEGHFPGRPTLPGVLMCEAIAQTGALAIVSDPKFVGKLPLFGGLDGKLVPATRWNFLRLSVVCRPVPAKVQESLASTARLRVNANYSLW